MFPCAASSQIEMAGAVVVGGFGFVASTTGLTGFASKEAMAAMALQQRAQQDSLPLEESTAATHHTQPKARLRLL